MSSARLTSHLVRMVIALAAAIAGPAMAFTADEDAWIETINAFSVEAADTGINNSIMVVSNAQFGDSPVASTWRGGRCVFILSAAGNSYSSTLQGYARSAATARLAAVAHEFGHCLHAASLERGETKLPPLKSAEAEAMADAFAVVWIYCVHPERYRDALTFFRTLRTRDASPLYSLGLEAIKDAAERVQRGHSCGRPAARYGIDQSLVSHIKHGRHWSFATERV